MDDSVSHLAGVPITIRRYGKVRTLQRCVICGDKLTDSNNLALPTPDDFPVYPPGHQIRFHITGKPKDPEDLGETIDLPTDSCIDLVEGG